MTLFQDSYRGRHFKKARHDPDQSDSANFKRFDTPKATVEKQRHRAYFIALLHHLTQLRGVLNFRIAPAAGIHDRLRGGSKGMLGNKTFRRCAGNLAYS